MLTGFKKLGSRTINSFTQNPFKYVFKNRSRMFSSFTSLLNENHFKIVDEEKILLSDLRNTLSNLNEEIYQREEIDLILDCSERIVDFFTVVIVGEFNSGKSTLINSLLGNEYLKSGILPTTDKICIFFWVISCAVSSIGSKI